MATRSGSTIVTSTGGKLTGTGNALIYCGSLCCEASGNVKTFDLGTVPAGTYTVEKISTGQCIVRSGGVQGVHASFNGQRFRNPADNGEYIYAQESLTLQLVEPDPLNPSQPFDCLNGACLPKSTYNTPGFFDSLSACQSGCAKNSNCTGECVSAAEIAALKQSANNLQSRICK